MITAFFTAGLTAATTAKLLAAAKIMTTVGGGLIAIAPTVEAMKEKKKGEVRSNE